MPCFEPHPLTTVSVLETLTARLHISDDTRCKRLTPLDVAVTMEYTSDIFALLASLTSLMIHHRPQVPVRESSDARLAAAPQRGRGRT